MKKIINKAKVLRYGYKLLYDPRSYIVSTGFIDSHLLKYPCDNKGKALPWISYPMIDLINERCTPNQKVFEFGAGYSTYFWMEKGNKVVSIEHNPNWYNEIKKRIEGNKNVVLYLEEDSNKYADFIKNFEYSFDLIFIDGIKRVLCAEKCLTALSESGVVIVDDTDREWFERIRMLYSKRGFKCLTLKGLRPRGFTQSQTSIFYRSNNCFDL